jgi:hypothetical protein
MSELQQIDHRGIPAEEPESLRRTASLDEQKSQNGNDQAINRAFCWMLAMHNSVLRA